MNMAQQFTSAAGKIEQINAIVGLCLQQAQHHREAGLAIGFVWPIGAAGGIAMLLQTSVVVTHDLQIIFIRRGHLLALGTSQDGVAEANTDRSALGSDHMPEARYRRSPLLGARY